MAEIFDLLASSSLALSLMFWNNLDASMIHLLAEMYDYGIHESSRRQGSKPNTCKPKGMTKSTKIQFLYVSLREELKFSCSEWIKPPLLTSMTIEVSSVLECVGISAGA